MFCQHQCIPLAAPTPNYGRLSGWRLVLTLAVPASSGSFGRKGVRGASSWGRPSGECLGKLILDGLFLLLQRGKLSLVSLELGSEFMFGNAGGGLLLSLGLFSLCTLLKGLELLQLLEQDRVRSCNASAAFA